MPRAPMPGRYGADNRPSEIEMHNDVPPRLELVRSTPSRPPIQVTGGPVPRGRRVRRFLRALWEFLSAPCFRP